MAKEQKIQELSVKGTVVSVFYPSLKKAVSVDVSKFSPKLALAGLLHGVGQRLGDAASGKSAAEKFEMAQRIIDEAFAQDSWELTTRTIDPKLVIEAAAAVIGVTEDEVRATLEKLGDKAVEKIKEWRGSLKIKAKILEIQAKRAAEAAADEEDEPSLD